MNAAILICMAAMGAGAEDLAGASRAFLAGLSAEQRDSALLDFEDAYRLDWHYFPRERRGIPFKDMDEAQHDLAMGVLRAGLSDLGVETVEHLRIIEAILYEWSNQSPSRDPEMFVFTIFGEPSDTAPWAVRYEGHHISLNWTVLNGRIVSSTPQFLGSNPAEVFEGPHAGLRPLAPLQDLAFEMLDTLTEEQRAVAVVAERAPFDIFTVAQSQVERLADEGIRHDALDAEQQAALWALIEAFAEYQAPALAEARLDAVKTAGLDAIHFAWMGATERGRGPEFGHYYRVQGPGFLIEYDNIQNEANHIHAVWRDFDGDFGRDLIAEHRAAVEH